MNRIFYLIIVVGTLTGCASVNWDEWDTFYSGNGRMNRADPNNAFYDPANPSPSMQTAPRKYQITPEEEEKYQALSSQIHQQKTPPPTVAK